MLAQLDAGGAHPGAGDTALLEPLVTLRLLPRNALIPTTPVSTLALNACEVPGHKRCGHLINALCLATWR